MIRALGALQRVERRRVFALPFEPAGEPIEGGRRRRTAALDAEPPTRIGALGERHPLAVASDGGERIAEAGDRQGSVHVWGWPLTSGGH